MQMDLYSSIYTGLGFVGILFLLLFFLWFFCHPIARDKMLVCFNKSYFICLFFLILSVIFIVSSCIYRYSSSTTHSVRALSEIEIGLRQVIGVDEVNEVINTDDKFGRIYSICLFLVQIVLFNGLIVSAIVGWTDRKIKKNQDGDIRYAKRYFSGIVVSVFDRLYPFREGCSRIRRRQFRNRYAVVIGAQEMTAPIIKNLLSTSSSSMGRYYPNDYVVLQTSRDVEIVRKELAVFIPKKQLNKIVIYRALFNSLEELRLLYLDNASEICILGENEQSNGSIDSMNMRCLNLIAQILENDYYGKKIEKKDCRVYLSNQKNLDLLNHVSPLINAGQNVQNNINNILNIKPFSKYEWWARMVMVNNQVNEIIGVDELKCATPQIEKRSIKYLPLDGIDGISYDSENYVHLVIIGMSQMGIAMGIQALHLAHYSNYHRNNELRTRITFIDSNADVEMLHFKRTRKTLFELIRHRYIDATTDTDSFCDRQWIDPMQQTKRWRHLSIEGKNFLDVEIEFIKGAIENVAIQNYLELISSNNRAVVTIVSCLLEPEEAFAASLLIPDRVYHSSQLQQVLVYQKDVSDLMTFTKNILQNFKLSKIIPFGMLYVNYSDYQRDIASKLYNVICDLNEIKQIDINNNINFIRYIDTRWNQLDKGNQMRLKYFVDKVTTIYKKVEDTEIMKQCEHSRYVMQQLLLGLAPYDLEQYNNLIALQKVVTNDVMKRKEFTQEKKHYEKLGNIDAFICDYFICDRVDPRYKCYTEMIISAIPKVMKMCNKMYKM